MSTSPAKHGVTVEDVLDIVFGRSVPLESHKQRTVLIGLSRGRILAVVLGPVPNQPREYDVFSARVASRKERRYYRDQIEGGER